MFQLQVKLFKTKKPWKFPLWKFHLALYFSNMGMEIFTDPHNLTIIINGYLLQIISLRSIDHL